MSARLRLAPVLAAGLVAGCQVGPHVSRYEPAQRPEGIACRLRLRSLDSALAGELLAVGDSAAVMVVERQVWRVPYRIITSSQCRLAGRLPIHSQKLVRSFADRHIRLSRYPQGVSPDLLRALLTAYQQPDVRVPRER